MLPKIVASRLYSLYRSESRKNQKEKNMKFKTDFLIEDYSTLCWFQAKKISIALAVALALAFGLTVATMHLIAGIAVLVFAGPIIYIFQKRRVIKRAEKRFIAFGTSSELSLELSKDDIIQQSNSGETRLAWQDVYAVRESDDSYYVFLAKNKAFYFPKRSFESDAHREEFLEYIEKYVDPKRVKLKK